MAVTISSGFPVRQTTPTTAGVTDLAGPSVTTSGATLLVAVAAWNSSNAAPTGSYSTAFSCGGLTWTKVTELIDTTTWWACISVWTATSASGLSAAASSLAFGCTDTISGGQVVVYSFDGASATIGSSGSSTGATTAEVTVTPLSVGSLLVGGASLTAASAGSIDGNTTEDFARFSDGVAGDYFAFHLTALTSNLSSVTFGYTGNAPGAGTSCVGYFEVQPAATATGSETVTASDAFDVYGPVRLVGSAFQSNDFQQNAFQILGGSAGGETNPYSRTQTETTTLTEAEVAASTKTSAQAEATTLSDTETAASGKQSTQSETVTLTEATAAQSGKQSTQAESVTLSDVQDTTLAHTSGTLYTDAVGETVTVTDSTAEASSKTSVEGESVTVTEAEAAASAKQSAQGETTTLSDTETASSGKTSVEGETATLTEATATASWKTASEAETVTLSDTQDSTVSSAGVKTGTQDETVACSDAYGVMQAYARTYTEAVTLSDAMVATVTSPHTGVAYSDTMSETVSVTDAMDASTIAVLAHRLRIWNGSAWV